VWHQLLAYASRVHCCGVFSQEFAFINESHCLHSLKISKKSHVLINFGRFEDDKPLLPVYKVSQDKAKSLGISFTPLEVTLGDTIESLKEKGFLTV
jgi:hypothetical protein